MAFAQTANRIQNAKVPLSLKVRRKNNFSGKGFNLHLVAGCDELELGLARVQGGPTDEEDPMNVALCRLDDSLKTVRCGYLWKLSRSVAPSATAGSASFVTSKWSKRWFMLRADSCLYFSKRDTVSSIRCFYYVSWCVKIGLYSCRATMLIRLHAAL